ncbi:hypothetical protein V6N11_069927 [Hibiscus sabdariffa]|uniref:Uncharacterized protein n=2 Tax=Hibiscus sabdariffa TaxID=183260 RepID=A0ABR2NHM7_9ROSI
MEERRRQRSVRRRSRSPTSSPVVAFPQLGTPSSPKVPQNEIAAITFARCNRPPLEAFSGELRPPLGGL